MRLINELLSNSQFLIDDQSVPYVVRDIINMNWWNTSDYLLGYKNNKRVSAPATKRMKLIGIIIKEYYRHRMMKRANAEKLVAEMRRYIKQEGKDLAHLKIASMSYRRNDSQYFYKNGKPTWLDCTSRAVYAWKYVAQNGYVDFDNVVRVLDGHELIDHCHVDSVYPFKDESALLFAEGENQVKSEIFSQRTEQHTVAEWCEKLGIKPISDRLWLYDKIKNVKTDPYKNNEKRLLANGKLFGLNEALYGYHTSYSMDASRASDASYASGASRASYASNASRASDASQASDASYASGASGASHASHASRASRASDASYASHASGASHASDAGVTSVTNIKSWFESDKSIGSLPGLSHPPVFKSNKYGIAGHWKINKDIVARAKLGWFDPFFGHGESALYAAKQGVRFVGIEINPDSMNGYILPYVQKTVSEFVENVEIRLGDSSLFYSDLVGQFDLCYTSPPYFDFEDYGFHNKVVQDCDNYDDYHERVTKPVFKNVKSYLVQGGILALQTEKNKTLKNKWIAVIEDLGFTLIEDTITGQEFFKYSKLSKRDQSLLLFVK